jgi:predicted TIM-barrel fold metal-dependent hydrolase
MFDSTLAMLNMIFGGILERYRGLKILLPHAGSTIPYLMGRIDHQYRINPECREKISKPPSEYFRSVYIDTAQAFYGPALMCAYHLVGPDRTIFGSDYPFASLEQSLNCVRSMNISQEEKERILGRNAMKLLNIR